MMKTIIIDIVYLCINLIIIQSKVHIYQLGSIILIHEPKNHIRIRYYSFLFCKQTKYRAVYHSYDGSQRSKVGTTTDAIPCFIKSSLNKDINRVHYAFLFDSLEVSCDMIHKYINIYGLL